MFPVLHAARRVFAFCFVLCAAVSSSLNTMDAQTKTVVFTASNDTILNPERGFYTVEETGMTRGQITPYRKLDPQRLRDLRRRFTLVFRYFGLKEWRTTDLPDSILQNIRDDFSAIRNAGLKCIPRFTYSANIGEPDASLSVILRHLDQLKPILQTNGDIIAVMQAGFIGAWGEWHSSTSGNQTLENKRAVLTKILDALPSERTVQVRVPHYKQDVLSLPRDATAALTPEQAFNGSPIARVGHHNDCFLADASDMGTYDLNGRLDTANIKAYLRLDNRFVPMGGETCQLSSFSECGNALHEAARLRWSFLNGDYDERVLASFANGGCMIEMQRKLGYRFSLVRAQFTSAVKPLGKFSFNVRIANTGWASPFNRREVELLLRHTRDSATYVVKLPTDPRFWLAGDTATVSITAGIPANVREGTYAVFLNFPDNNSELRSRAEYSIRLANESTWESSSGYNILDSIVVDRNVNSEIYDGLIWFQPLGSIMGNSVPTLYSLEPNYPNPFNATTTIRFVLARHSEVELSIFDVTGKRVVQLVNDSLPLSAIPYSTRFDAKSFASGMYVAQVRATPIDGSGAATFVASRKLLLIK